MNESNGQAASPRGGGSVYPFFWQQGEDHAVLRAELDKIYQTGARGFCVEARPHLDFAGPHWWRDMDMILDYAQAHGMKVWLLDDDHFPTGHANNAFSKGNHPLANRFLTVHSTDAAGPIRGGAMLLKSLLPEDAVLVGVAGMRRADPDTRELLPDTCVDLTGHVRNGWLRWDVPKGLWRVLVFFTTSHGNGKLDYFNILDSDSVRVLIDRVYEPHFERYARYFGTTFCGFFSDEPEFGNLPWYDFQARLGTGMPFIPWSGELQRRLETCWGDRFLRNLAALWFPAGENSGRIRYAYMDQTSKQLAVAFSKQIGDWCDAHGVMHVGHVIEDDNVHGRLGCGTAHFFRSESDMRMAGIDVVLLQVVPEMDQCVHQWVASDRDGEFFHYGLAKLGSSLAHIDAKKNGNTMCEIFGAYGWQEGVGLMKWLADHMVSRGVNYFVPHAFSPRPFPDADCPPHFYAHGNHAQFGFFCDLVQYMNRLSGLFQGGRYPANVAVLYHADSEWAGDAMLFQKPVRALLERQIDCDVVPADLFDVANPYGMTFDGHICVGEQRYGALVIPACQYLPLAAARFALSAMESGFPVLFVDHPPKGICEETGEEAALIRRLQEAECLALGELADALLGYITPMVRTDKRWPRLRTYPYVCEDGLYVCCLNESTTQTVTDGLWIAMDGKPVCASRLDVLHDARFALPANPADGGYIVPLVLEPGESTVIHLSAREGEEATAYRPYPVEGWRVTEGWAITAISVPEGERLSVADCDDGSAFPDVTDWAAAHEFSGSLVYECTVRLTKEAAGAYALRLFGALDCAEIKVNGHLEARILGAPSCAVVRLVEGDNRLRIKLPVTPVFKAGDNWSSLLVLPPLGMTDKPLLCVWEQQRA